MATPMSADVHLLELRVRQPGGRQVLRQLRQVPTGGLSGVRFPSGEEARTVVGKFYKVVEDAVSRFEGTVTNYLGDGRRRQDSSPPP